MKDRETLSFEYTPADWAKLSRLLEKQLAAVQWTTAHTANLIRTRVWIFEFYETKIERVIREKGNSKVPDPAGFPDLYTSPEARRAKLIVLKRRFPHRNFRLVEPRVQPYNLLACSPVDIIRCILECEASEYRFGAYDDIDRKANEAELKKVVECCNFIMLALSSDRPGLSLNQNIGPEDYKLSTNNMIDELRKGAESILGAHLSYREFHKKRQNDPRRNLYLRQLCDHWMYLGGRPKVSFDSRTGHASGAFVGFIQSAAKPVLGAMTADAARRAIENWRKTGRAGRQPRTVFLEGPVLRRAQYARLKMLGSRKQS